VGGVAEDMVLQREASKDEEDVSAPLGVVGRLKVQNNGNQVPNVLDDGGLIVEAGNDGGVGEDRASLSPSW
jgi:hypothetical protein